MKQSVVWKIAERVLALLLFAICVVGSIICAEISLTAGSISLGVGAGISFAVVLLG